MKLTPEERKIVAHYHKLWRGPLRTGFAHGYKLLIPEIITNIQYG
jgi:hypothetical protein